MNPKSLLFEDALADDGRPLFATQRELAQILVTLPGSGFETKHAENVRIFLGQVLKPSNESGSRPLSTNLKRALPRAIATRIGDTQRANAVTDQVLEAFSSIKELDGLARPYTDQFEWNRLIASANNENLKRVVIITSEPAETMPDESINAHLLTNAMIERIINPEEDGVPPLVNPSYDNEAIYEFFVPKEATARKMHERLIGATSERFPSLDDTQARQRVLSAQREGRLSIFALNSPGLLLPMCVFEPMSPKIEGYNLYYHEGNQVSVAVLNRAALDNWVENFYLPIFTGFSENKRVLELYKPIPIGQTRAIVHPRSSEDIAA